MSLCLSFRNRKIPSSCEWIDGRVVFSKRGGHWYMAPNKQAVVHFNDLEITRSQRRHHYYLRTANSSHAIDNSLTRKAREMFEAQGYVFERIISVPFTTCMIVEYLVFSHPDKDAHKRWILPLATFCPSSWHKYNGEKAFEADARLVEMPMTNLVFRYGDIDYNDKRSMYASFDGYFEGASPEGLQRYKISTVIDTRSEITVHHMVVKTLGDQQCLYQSVTNRMKQSKHKDGEYKRVNLQHVAHKYACVSEPTVDKNGAVYLNWEIDYLPKSSNFPTKKNWKFCTRLGVVHKGWDASDYKVRQACVGASRSLVCISTPSMRESGTEQVIEMSVASHKICIARQVFPADCIYHVVKDSITLAHCPRENKLYIAVSEDITEVGHLFVPNIDVHTFVHATCMRYTMAEIKEGGKDFVVCMLLIDNDVYEFLLTKSLVPELRRCDPEKTTIYGVPLTEVTLSEHTLMILASVYGRVGPMGPDVCIDYHLAETVDCTHAEFAAGVDKFTAVKCVSYESKSTKKDNKKYAWDQVTGCINPPSFEPNVIEPPEKLDDGPRQMSLGFEAPQAAPVPPADEDDDGGNWFHLPAYGSKEAEECVTTFDLSKVSDLELEDLNADNIFDPAKKPPAKKPKIGRRGRPRAKKPRKPKNVQHGVPPASAAAPPIPWSDELELNLELSDQRLVEMATATTEDWYNAAMKESEEIDKDRTSPSILDDPEIKDFTSGFC